MMIHGHRTVAAPFALGAVTVAELTVHPGPETLAIMGFLIVWSCSWNDLDHPSGTASNELWIISKGMSWIVRWVSYGVYLGTRTKKDAWRRDAHRGFTHTIEGCLLFALTVGVATSQVPIDYVSQNALLWAFSVFVGTISHLAGDILTPSGIPLQITFKIDGMRWQRYALGWHGLDMLDGAHRPKHHPGFFRTNSVGEHYIAIPLVWVGTIVMAMLITGTFTPLVMGILGL